MVFILVVVINWGIICIRGINYKLLYGILIDLLDCLFIILILFYIEEELRKILDICCEEEDVEMFEDVRDLFIKIGYGYFY